MNLKTEDNLDPGKKEKGRQLQELLKSVDNEEKNALIGYKCVRGQIPIGIDDADDYTWMEFKSTIDSLAELGVCFINEEDFKEFLNRMDGEIKELCLDHEAWATVTLLEISEHESFEEPSFESIIYDDGEQINSIGIDLVGKSDEWKLFTCKFNVTTQHESAGERIQQLQLVVEELPVDAIVALGTLAIQHKDVIKSTVGADFDKLVSGEDLLDLRRE